MLEVANGKILALLFICWLIIKSYSLRKLTQSNLFLLYFIEENNNWRGEGLMKKILRQAIGNYLILNSPPPYF